MLNNTKLKSNVIWYQSISNENVLGVTRLRDSTPTEAAIGSSASGSLTSINAHNRTPSQTMVIEHLQQELGTKSIPTLKLVEEAYVDMSENSLECRVFELVSESNCLSTKAIN